MRKNHYIYAILLVLGLALLAGCSRSVARHESGVGRGTGSAPSSGQQKPVQSQAPVKPEKNPPGDIPDNQAFVVYQSPGGSFQIKVPEGWARTMSKSGVDFTDKLNTVSVKWNASSSAPTIESAKSVEVPTLSRTDLAFQLADIKQVTLPGGPAVLITYRVNSAPNQVTGKQYRMDMLRYEFFKNGTQANLVLSSPVGADNVDPWRIVSESFKWLQ